jgi:hypothetical protein
LCGDVHIKNVSADAAVLPVSAFLLQLDKIAISVIFLRVVFNKKLKSRDVKILDLGYSCP